ncbi:MAG: hypothetical protein IJL06_09395 [Kiritimatiellae bacterium]|nr:hypothetical protein [Kiritimatiellia bacterium]
MDYPTKRLSAGFCAVGGGIAGLCAALAAFAALAAPGARAETPAAVAVEDRGLPVVPGVLRDGNKVDWGFANFVAFGPGWAYTAQDYAAKELKKDTVEDPALGRGLLYTGKIWAGSRGLAFREEFFDVSEDGAARARVRWTISSQDGKPMQLERAFLRFPLALADFAGGTLSDKSLPADYGQEWIDAGGVRSVEAVSKDGTKILRLDVSRGKVAVRDGRKDKLERFELCIDFPDAKNATSSTVEFDRSGAFADSLGRPAGRVDLGLPPPPLMIAAGDKWVVFPWTNDVKPGSILDFSKVVPREAPAGKDGFARVSPEGHFVFEKDAKKTPRRFVGGNLCFGANFLSKEEADRAVQDFVARGWNAIRLHHLDVTITKDEWNDIWNRRTWSELSPEKLDKLDYLVAACKKASLYVTFDLYAMGSYGSCEGFDKPLHCGTIKAIVPIHKPAEDLWFKRSMELFDHVNPYTGVAWKDEPTVLFVTLLNEDSIASVWWGAADVYVGKYNEWAKGKGYPELEKEDIGKHKEFAEFLYEVKSDANRRMTKRLKEAGVKTLVSGGNWWENMAQVYEREALEVVDNHQYADIYYGASGNVVMHFNNQANLQNGSPAYSLPIMMASTRVFGRPFTVTEWNFCNPNRWRAEGGLTMGAYAALQDWDAIFRFAWSHERAPMFKPSPSKGFDIVTDPLSQLTERQAVLLFGRRDAAPATGSAAYGVTSDEAFAGGLGDMWSRGLFPTAFTELAYGMRIGSFAADGGRKPAIAVDKVYTAANKDEIPAFNRAGASETRETEIDYNKGSLRVSTPRTAGVCSLKKEDLSAGPLSVSGATAFCSVSASSMDGADLERSKRILVLHLTDVLNTGAVFTNEKRTDMTNWGELPYLAAAGEAKIALKNANPGLKVWAVAADGTHLREVPATYENGVYRFTARIAAGEGADAPTMVYELAE